MPKQVIVMMNDYYPFGQCEQSTNENTKVLVRKIYQASIQQRNKLLQKANILKKLKIDQMIKLQNVLEEDQTIHFLFEYVPIRLETWISNINDQFIETFRDQVIKFSSYLANNFIKIDFKLKNIGMGHNYGAKYFLDPTFVYDLTINKEKLKSQYIRDITNLFKPYIQSNHSQQKPTNQITVSPKLHQGDKKQPGKKINSISPPTYNCDEQTPTKDENSKKKKEKLQKYYKQMNASMDAQNQKILQEFMNVLDDEDEQGESSSKNVPFTTNPQKTSGLYPSMLLSSQEIENKTSLKKNQHSQVSPHLKQTTHQNVEIQKQKKSNIHVNNNTAISPPPNIAKNSEYILPEQQQSQSKARKENDDLQDRIKKAIQNSKSIINKFKLIKETRS